MEYTDSENNKSDDDCYVNPYSDDEYLPESLSEDSIDDEYVVTEDESVSEEYLSDESDEPRRKRKKRASNVRNFPQKRPALKNKSKNRRSESETSTETESEIQFTDTPASEHDSNVEESANLKAQNIKTIEKVIKRRVGTRGDVGANTSVYNITILNHQAVESSDTEEQFLIKWKGQSYLHCTWESHESLKMEGVAGCKKVENFLKRSEYQTEMNGFDILLSCDESIIEYTTIDRILSKCPDPNVENTNLYLCKWKSLNYEDSTWESAELVNRLFPSSIEEFSIREKDFYNPFDSKILSSIIYEKNRLFRVIDQLISSQSESDGLKLRDYQIEGVKWLIHSCMSGRGVILADEMGLGKTVQIIMFIKLFKVLYGINGPTLVVVPLSTLDNWLRHFAIWAPELYAVSFVGNAQSRQIIKDYELIDPSTQKLKFNVLVTTYEWVFKEADLFGSFSWFAIVIDEGHRIKNENSLLYRCLYDFKSHNRILMTGTPLQNSLRELWSLLHFIMPNKFKEASSIEQYGEFEDQQKGYEQLKIYISEYILRRTKKDVEKSLPPKTEQILRVDMTNTQKKYYRWILTKNYEELSKEAKGTTSGFLNIIMELKKCCNHSNLVRNDLYDPKNDINLLLIGSGKLILLDKLLTRMYENKSRVLIFSQMVTMLNILSHYLTLRNLKFQRLDGSMSEAQRVRAIDHFNNPESDDFCFLLSTKAGGLGINLVTADVVVIYDSDWNPQNDIQAQARAHRIGQKKQVKIYRLVTKSSIEETIIERAKRKMVLDHLVIQTMNSKSSSISSTNSVKFLKDELALILKFGAEELFKENIQDGSQEPLQNMDLDDILKISEPNDDAAHHLSRGEEFLSCFKVANFNTEDIERDLDQEYAEWKDIIPHAELDRIQNEKLVKKEAELNLPPRRKAAIPTVEVSNLESDEEESIHIPHVKVKDLNKFIKEYQKFCDPSKRLEEILKSCNISFRDSDLDLYQQMSDFIESSLFSTKPKSPSLKINHVSIDLVKYKKVRSALDAITNQVESFIKENKLKKVEDIKKKFTLPSGKKARAKCKWNKSWNRVDDHHLLIGVYYYGLENWKSIVEDKHLSLSKKLKDSKGRFQNSNLFAHVMNLVKSFEIPKPTVKPVKRSKINSKQPIHEHNNTEKPKEEKMDDQLVKKYVTILTSVKKNITNIEGISSKELMKKKDDIEKIGKIIHSRKTSLMQIKPDDLWSFVSQFTSSSYQDIKEFYLENCVNNVR